MKAAVLEGLKKLVVKEVEEPRCENDQVKIKVHKAAICNFSDLEVYEGTSPVMEALGYPHIFGHENSGEIVEVGKNIEGFSIGDRIAFYYKGTGAFAEYNILTPSKLAIAKLDENVSYDEGAILEIAGGGAMRNVYGSGIKLGDNILTMGVGPAGLFAGMCAKLSGAKSWIALDLYDFRLHKALELGATAVFNILKMSQKEIIDAIHEQVGEIDIVFETMGEDRSPDKSGLDFAVNIVKFGGNIRLFTYSGERYKFFPGEVQTKGVNLVGRKPSLERTRKLINLAQKWVAEDRYPIKRLITHHIGLDDIEEALKLIKEKSDKVLKVVVDI